MLGAVAVLRSRGVDGIILGCTELPLLLEADLADADLLNPGALLAEASVRQVMAACKPILPTAWWKRRSIPYLSWRSSPPARRQA